MAIGWLLSACLWMAASCGPAVAATAATAAASTSAVVAASPCPEVFLPELSLELDCSTNAVVPGGLRTFSGTLRNRGNVEVRNLSIARVLPDSTVTVRVQTSLLPGVSVPFSGDYRVPAVESCQTPVRVVAAGVDACRGQSVGAIGSLACPVATSPALSVAMGAPVRVFGPVPLAPGESAVFAVPVPAGWGEDPDRDFVEALAEDGCRGTGVSARAGCQGLVVPPVPVLRSIAHGAGGATIRWVSQPGTTYRLEYSDGLPATSWIPLAERVTATGDSAVMTDPAATDARRFYRVLVVSE